MAKMFSAFVVEIPDFKTGKLSLTVYGADQTLPNLAKKVATVLDHWVVAFFGAEGRWTKEDVVKATYRKPIPEMVEVVDMTLLPDGWAPHFVESQNAWFVVSEIIGIYRPMNIVLDRIEGEKLVFTTLNTFDKWVDVFSCPLDRQATTPQEAIENFLKAAVS